MDADKGKACAIATQSTLIHAISILYSVAGTREPAAAIVGWLGHDHLAFVPDPGQQISGERIEGGSD